MYITTWPLRAILLGIILSGMFALSQISVLANAQYRETPTFTSQWDVPHLSEQAPLLLIDATDDNEVHVLNYHDQTLFEYEDDGEIEDSWDDFSCVEFSEIRNIFVDHNENVFVLESGAKNMLHRFSKEYFEEHCEEDNDEEDELNPESDDEYEEDEDEDEEEYEDDEDDLADVLSWDIEAGIDVAASSSRAFVITTDSLTQIELDTGKFTTIPMTGNVAVAPGQGNRVLVLTEGGTVVKAFNNKLGQIAAKELERTSVDLDADRRGNMYLAGNDGFIRQYDKNFAAIQSIQLPESRIPGQVTISHDGDLFVADSNNPTIFHYNFRDVPEPRKKDKAIYRFWSKEFRGHFFTSSYEEAQAISENNEDWEYERIAYKYIDKDDQKATGVYRFWSENYKHHFYTSSETERVSIIENDPNWAYEGEAYNVYGTQQPGSVPTYRFYSEQYKGHFYTTSEQEKENLEQNDPNWVYEGIAWWVVEEEV